MERASVLLVEDDSRVARTVVLYLENEGYRVSHVSDGRQALARLAERPPDLVVLDLMLPGLDGLAVCRRIREGSRVPVIMLTARSTEDDRLRGFDLGADDYVTKPFSPRELTARVRALIRRARGEPDGHVLRKAGLILDPARHACSVDGRPVGLTAVQFRLLSTLARAPGRVFSRSELIERVLGPDFEGSERTIDAHVKNLRKRLDVEGSSASMIETVISVGYRFVRARQSGEDAR